MRFTSSKSILRNQYYYTSYYIPKKKFYLQRFMQKQHKARIRQAYCVRLQGNRRNISNTTLGLVVG